MSFTAQAWNGSQPVVMAGLVPAIHVLLAARKNVDTRHKAGHDVRRRRCVTYASPQAQHEHGTAVSNPPQFVLATRGGGGVVMNWVASSIAGPSGVGILAQNGTRMRVPAIGANAISMLRWAARYLMTGRSGMKPATGVKYSAHTTTGPR